MITERAKSKTFIHALVLKVLAIMEKFPLHSIPFRSPSGLKNVSESPSVNLKLLLLLLLRKWRLKRFVQNSEAAFVHSYSWGYPASNFNEVSTFYNLRSKY